MECSTQRRDRIPATAPTRKQWRVGSTWSVTLRCESTAANEVLDQIRRNPDHSRLVEFAVADRQRAGIDIEGRLRKPQQLSSS